MITRRQALATTRRPRTPKAAGARAEREAEREARRAAKATAASTQARAKTPREAPASAARARARTQREPLATTRREALAQRLKAEEVAAKVARTRLLEEQQAVVIKARIDKKAARLKQLHVEDHA